MTACNLREALKSLPCSPFSMCVDEETLCRTARLDRRMAAHAEVRAGRNRAVVTTAGNLVLDIIVKHDTEKYFWTPIPITDNYANPNVVDLLVTSSYLLDEVIELVKCMGLVFNPKFYLSLSDFHLENAADVFEGIGRPVRDSPAPAPSDAARQLLLVGAGALTRHGLVSRRRIRRSRLTSRDSLDHLSDEARPHRRRVPESARSSVSRSVCAYCSMNRYISLDATAIAGTP